MTQDGPVPFTPEEEAQWDAMEAAWAAGESDRKAAAIREERTRLLASSDWIQMPDYSGANKEAWATYRQALRDITGQEGFPNTVTWPTKPE
jgi:uncharacterized membrane-anchored protein